MTIAVINPGSGNITSICDCLERLGFDYRVLTEPDLQGIRQILIPGQGRFGPVMRFLNDAGWVQPLKQWTERDQPLVGICVGMQVLFESSEEDPDTPGMGLFSGRVSKLNSPKQPMMGWARVHWESGNTGTAYFVNSYVVRDSAQATAYTTYGERFCSALKRGNLNAFQFHPEKSGPWGQELLKQCLIY